jgi:TetR/AcrR family transcriptional regulator, transcriptional repressor for nem operon
MSRPREFDDEIVLNVAADVFTAHGYAGTSISMLTDATGMGKQSLYNAFGDKESLYLKAIDCAVSRFGLGLAGIERTQTGKEALEMFFSILIGACVNPDPAKNNCILSSGLLESVQQDNIAQKLEAAWDGNQRFLRSLIVRGQADRSVNTEINADDLANLLMTLMSGIRVTARVIKTKSQMQRMTQQALQILNPTAHLSKGSFSRS